MEAESRDMSRGAGEDCIVPQTMLCLGEEEEETKEAGTCGSQVDRARQTFQCVQRSRGCPSPRAEPEQERRWEPSAVSSAALAIGGSSKGCGWPSVHTCVPLSEEGGGRPWNLWGKGASWPRGSTVTAEGEQGFTRWGGC